MRALPRILIAGLAVPFCAPNPAAQAHAGHYFVSLRPNRIGVVHPRIPGPGAFVQQLPPALNGVTSFPFSLAVRESDGMLLVGTRAVSGTQVRLHWLHLQSLSVVEATSAALGVASPTFFGARVTDLAMLPDGRALAMVQGIQGSPLAIVDDAGTSVKVPLENASFFQTNGNEYVVTDQTGSIAFFTRSSDLYSIPLPGGGTATRVYRSTGSLSSLARGRNNDLVFAHTGTMYSLDLQTGIATAARPVPASLFCRERATDEVAVLQVSPFGGTSTVSHVSPNGSVTPLTTFNAYGEGIACAPAPSLYGSGTGGYSTYGWQVDPTPGGLPRLGNAQFGVQSLASSGGTAGVVFASGTPTRATVVGFELLLGFPQVFLGALPAAGPLPLPIPNAMPLLGQILHLQSYHLDAGAPQGIGASTGLRVTVLR